MFRGTSNKWHYFLGGGFYCILMPKYRNKCGFLHSSRLPCPTSEPVLTMATRSTSAAANMASQTGPKEGHDLSSSMANLNIEEWEKRTKEDIEEVEAEIRLAELQSRLEFLKVKRERVIKAKPDD